MIELPMQASALLTTLPPYTTVDDESLVAMRGAPVTWDEKQVGTITRVWQQGQELHAEMVIDEDSPVAKSLRGTVSTHLAAGVSVDLS